MLFATLLCCTFFFGQSAVAQSAAKAQCTPAQKAECAKVCDSKAMMAAVGLSPQVVKVAQTQAATTPADCQVMVCDPADCPLICQILCPIICGSNARTAAAVPVKNASCTPRPACNTPKAAKVQVASIE